MSEEKLELKLDDDSCPDCGQGLINCLKDCDLSAFFELEEGEKLEGFTMVDLGEVSCILERDGRFFQLERDWEYIPYERMFRKYHYPHKVFEVKKVREVKVSYHWIKIASD